MSDKLRELVRDIISRLPPEAFKWQLQDVPHCASCLQPMTKRSYPSPHGSGERWCYWCNKENCND